jgi:hypothetical protein
MRNAPHHGGAFVPRSLRGRTGGSGRIRDHMPTLRALCCWAGACCGSGTIIVASD